MRPERLILKGFGAFRHRTEIDFSGVELFALTGPTGSGKTTVLDGMCFALYGSVPRHGKGSVAPVVTQGLVEATVAFRFSIGDQIFQVARRVRKDPKRKAASTGEASLERVDNNGAVETLATGAGQVTDRVMDLLGLDFDQFTTCVLLPQGEFARFLHDKPAGRQELLTALLDLGIYDRVGQAALVRQRVAEDRLAMIDRRLVELEAMTEQDLAEARAREVELTDLLRWVEDTQPELAALEAEARDQQAEAGRQQAMLAAVRSLRLPEDLDAAREQVAAFRTEEEHAANALEAARSAVADLAEQRAALPAKTQITAWVEAHHALGSARAELERAAPVAVEMRERLLTATTALAEAREAFGAAADADRAAHLRLGLKVGGPCPVCGQAITTIPGAAPETAAEEAQATLTRAEQDEAEARVARAQADNLVQRLQDRIADLTSQLDQVAALDELAALAGRVEAHEKSSTEAQAALAAARERLEEIAKSRQMTVARESAIRGKLQAAWSRVAQAGLEPPPLELEDVFRSWRQLEEWRASAEPRVAESAEKASALVDEVGARRRLVAEAITRRLESLAVRMGTSPPRDAVFDALSVVKGRRQQIEDALTEALARAAERESVAFEQQLARRLNLELRADHFKQWLFDEVFAS
ncbi:MAG TPA: SMC family ATPase, partial [Acidimicrobiia bacterium]|nr:SMC family ATPase [Acidimicrobiia bacterium]